MTTTEYEPLRYTSIYMPHPNQKVYDALVDTVGWFDESFTGDNAPYSVATMAGSSECAARAIFGETKAFATNVEPKRAVDFLLHASGRNCERAGWQHHAGASLVRTAVAVTEERMQQNFEVSLISAEIEDQRANGSLFLRASVRETVKDNHSQWQAFNGETRMSWQQPVTTVEQLRKHMDGMQRLVLGELTVAMATDLWISGDVAAAGVALPKGRLSRASHFRV
jgi:hypothetical protein